MCLPFLPRLLRCQTCHRPVQMGPTASMCCLQQWLLLCVCWKCMEKAFKVKTWWGMSLEFADVQSNSTDVVTKLWIESKEVDTWEDHPTQIGMTTPNAGPSKCRKCLTRFKHTISIYQLVMAGFIIEVPCGNLARGETKQATIFYAVL